MFLSDALMAQDGIRFHTTQEPGSAVNGWSCSSAATQCIYPHCTIDSLWTGQHPQSVLFEPPFFFKFY